MKKFNLLLSLCSCALFLFGTVACGDDDDDFDIESILPTTARTFIHTHYPNQKAKTIRTKDQTQEAILANGSYICFNKSGVWKNVDEFNKKTVPESIISLIPNKIPAYFAITLPGSIISQIEIKPSGNYSIEIVTTTPTNYIFDSNGDFLRTEADIDSEDLPDIAKEFIKYHFNGVKIVITSKDNDEYELFFNNGISIDFNLLGAWKEVDGYHQVELPTSVINLLPEKAIKFLNEDYNKHKISSIEKTNTNYYKVSMIQLLNKKLVFDSEGDFINIETD